MELEEAIISRRSIRAFRENPVAKSLLQEIMSVALWSPSWGNTQPWEFVIVGGNALKKIISKTRELFIQGTVARPELEMPMQWGGVKLNRHRELGKSLLTALSISREDKEKRNEHYVNMVSLFGAPNIIYVYIDGNFNQYSLIDIGMIMQTIALLATGNRLGTCFLAQAVIYPDIIKECLGIPDSKRIIVGIAIGYPVEGHPANNFIRKRGTIEEFVNWADID